MCALRKGNDGDMCEQSLAEHPFHPFCCQYGGARTIPPGALQQLWIDVSVRCPHAERYNERTLQRKCVETRCGSSSWRSGENEAIWHGRETAGL